MVVVFCVRVFDSMAVRLWVDEFNQAEEKRGSW